MTAKSYRGRTWLIPGLEKSYDSIVQAALKMPDIVARELAYKLVDPDDS